ncbi:hypothetical protein [Actinomycetospora sp. NBRC 106378]|uniref:hypothetical protein n=1 Tax=Actinomycetospora sp. NBRC 106378 TaxID=3032208 RepID=UPI0024A19D03|nr:hypothetical protein [Actinomycetospora sp. NBRC 106378]GLZ55171.1 hypothetical protein Acsp07_47880 [Actinomycetospora sp. NBRC 106378]
METRRRAARLGLVAPLVLAAALTGAAVFTVERAGCDDPGSLVITHHGPVLVGGCSVPALVTPGHTAPHGSAEDQADARRG